MTIGFAFAPLPLETDLSVPHLSHHDYATPSSPSHLSTPPNEPTDILNPFGSPLSVGHRRLDAFHIICLIGKGGFGKVFMVRHKATAQIYAMKVMDKDALIQRRAVSDAHAERNVLAMVGQTEAPFIVRLHVAFQTTRRVYLVMDFASGGELMFHLRREAMLSEDDARFYAAELLVALQTLHAMDVVHRDIKPENVLLDGAGHLVLTDFGLAKELTSLSDQTHSWCGSDDYMAPEIIARTQHSGKPADYWAYGIFIYDCLCGNPPFSPLHEKGKVSRKRLHERILKNKPKLPGYLSPDCHSLLRKLLTKDVGKRLADPQQIRAHPWFSPIDWDLLTSKQVAPPIVPSQSSPTACFSPSLTKVDHSAPHSPVNLGAATASVPIAVGANINGSGNGATTGESNMWQGFSFVAPGMEVHFELAPPAVDRAHAGGLGGGCNAAAAMGLGRSPETGATSPVQRCDGGSGKWEDPLLAELAEFSVDAQEAVEIVEQDDV